MMRNRLACALALVSTGMLACGPAGGGNEEQGSGAESLGTDSLGSDEGNDDNSSTGPGEEGESGEEGPGDEGEGEEGPSEDSGGEGPDTKWDLGELPDAGLPACGGGDEEPEFSFLWAANSSQGTISKIDTETVQEMGRYQVRPDGAGSPSRTSVSLSGHVAVASRSSGITKFYATEESCEESNGMPGIQTSQGNAALPWDQEECRAWYTPFNYSSQRPVAWAPGTLNEATCEWEDELLWTAGRNGSSGADVILLDGETGMVLETVPIPGLKSDPYGIYGAAVDSEGNFWGTGWASGNHLIRVELDTMVATVWDGPSSTGNTSHWYGMTVDVDGYIWNCASRVARFDPETEEWTVSPELGSWTAGCMADSTPADEGGKLWLGSSGVRSVDRTTMQLVDNFPTPSSYGVSVDYAGYVWAVSGNGAHRVDPSDGTVTSYNGLFGAYTYSDMTGAALNAVGGTPSG